jgi:cytochrome c
MIVVNQLGFSCVTPIQFEVGIPHFSDLLEFYMRQILVASFFATAAALAPFAANASEDLAKKSMCTSCHAVDKKILGPAYKDVATKYKGDAKAEAMLIDKVKKGGSGVWGAVPMPPHPQVSDADLKTLVKWALATK